MGSVMESKAFTVLNQQLKSAVVFDVQKLLRQLLLLEGDHFNFEAFKSLWKENQLHLLHHARFVKGTANEVSRQLLLVFLELLLNSPCTIPYDPRISFSYVFMLYCVYLAQLRRPRTKITISPICWKRLITVESILSRFCSTYSVAYAQALSIIRKLTAARAFDYALYYHDIRLKTIPDTVLSTYSTASSSSSPIINVGELEEYSKQYREKIAFTRSLRDSNPREQARKMIQHGLSSKDQEKVENFVRKFKAIVSGDNAALSDSKVQQQTTEAVPRRSNRLSLYHHIQQSMSQKATEERVTQSEDRKSAQHRPVGLSDLERDLQLETQQGSAETLPVGENRTTDFASQVKDGISFSDSEEEDGVDIEDALEKEIEQAIDHNPNILKKDAQEHYVGTNSATSVNGKSATGSAPQLKDGISFSDSEEEDGVDIEDALEKEIEQAIDHNPNILKKDAQEHYVGTNSATSVNGKSATGSAPQLKDGIFFSDSEEDGDDIEDALEKEIEQAIDHNLNISKKDASKPSLEKNATSSVNGKGSAGYASQLKNGVSFSDSEEENHDAVEVEVDNEPQRAAGNDTTLGNAAQRAESRPESVLQAGVSFSDSEGECEANVQVVEDNKNTLSNLIQFAAATTKNHLSKGVSFSDSEEDHELGVDASPGTRLQPPIERGTLETRNRVPASSTGENTRYREQRKFSSAVDAKAHGSDNNQECTKINNSPVLKPNLDSGVSFSDEDSVDDGIPEETPQVPRKRPLESNIDKGIIFSDDDVEDDEENYKDRLFTQNQQLHSTQPTEVSSSTSDDDDIGAKPEHLHLGSATKLAAGIDFSDEDISEEKVSIENPPEKHQSSNLNRVSNFIVKSRITADALSEELETPTDDALSALEKQLGLVPTSGEASKRQRSEISASEAETSREPRVKRQRNNISADADAALALLDNTLAGAEEILSAKRKQSTPSRGEIRGHPESDSATAMAFLDSMLQASCSSGKSKETRSSPSPKKDTRTRKASSSTVLHQPKKPESKKTVVSAAADAALASLNDALGICETNINVPKASLSSADLALSSLDAALQTEKEKVPSGRKRVSRKRTPNTQKKSPSLGDNKSRSASRSCSRKRNVAAAADDALACLDNALGTSTANTADYTAAESSTKKPRRKRRSKVRTSSDREKKPKPKPKVDLAQLSREAEQLLF